ELPNLTDVLLLRRREHQQAAAVRQPCERANPEPPLRSQRLGRAIRDLRFKYRIVVAVSIPYPIGDPLPVRRPGRMADTLGWVLARYEFPLARAVRVGDHQRELFARLRPHERELLAVGRKTDGVTAFSIH